MVKSSKWNDRNRHKDEGIRTHVRQANRRERYDARLNVRADALDALDELRLDRVITTLCREAGV